MIYSDILKYLLLDLDYIFNMFNYYRIYVEFMELLNKNNQQAIIFHINNDNIYVSNEYVADLFKLFLTKKKLNLKIHTSYCNLLL